MFDNEETISALERNHLGNKAWTVFMEVDIGANRSKYLNTNRILPEIFLVRYISDIIISKQVLNDFAFYQNNHLCYNKKLYVYAHL